MNYRERVAEAVQRTHEQVTRLRRLHPDWPICPACRWPIHPAAMEGGYSTHPTCDTEAKALQRKENQAVAGRIEAPAGERVNAPAGRLGPIAGERSLA